MPSHHLKIRLHAFLRPLALSAALMASLKSFAQIEHLDATRLNALVKSLPEHERQAKGALKTHLASLAKARPLALANAARVAADMAGQDNKDAQMALYAVPAISDRMRLPDAYPDDGALFAPIRIVATPGEYEPASFVIYPFADLGKATFTPGPLKSSKGVSIAETQLDLRVVKVWYQNANGWISYFMDTGLQLTPELLLHDEDLIRVDTAVTANYARIRKPDGTFFHQWITPPKALDTTFGGPAKNYTFRPMKEDFEDATTIQPVSLDAGVFKQLWLTVHVPENTAAGIYTGMIAVSAKGHQNLAEIPIILRVLPFNLPEPKTYFDPDRDFFVSTYNYVSREIILDQNGNDPELAARQYLGILKNMRRHNIALYKVRYPPGEDLAQQLNLAREAGMRMDTIIGSTMRVGRDTSHEGLLATRRYAEETRDFFMKHLGHINVYLQSGDEPGASWIVAMRPHWKIYQDLGFKFYTAGHESLYHKAGYIYDMHPAAGNPDDPELTRRWNEIGHAYVGWYAGQHVGVENPAYIRKQYGLTPYRNNFSMLCNYSFAMIPWNDLAKDVYKPMVFAYATRGELVDTMAWEGFREGVDDIRYATLLNKLAIEADNPKNPVERRYAGRKALQYLADIDITGGDMNTARLEIIDRILQLKAMH